TEGRPTRRWCTWRSTAVAMRSGASPSPTPSTRRGSEDMTGGTFTTRIQAPVPSVWALVSDLDTHASWSPKPYTVEWLSGEPNQVGSRFRSVGWVPGDKH